MRVLIANDRLGRAPDTLHGAGRLMIEWNLGFRSSDVEVTSCILRAPDALGRQLADEGIPLVFFGDRRFSPASVRKFVGLIRRQRIEVLHLQGYGATALGRIAGRITSTPTVIHLHSRYGDDGPYPWYARQADRLLGPATQRVIAVSEPVRRFCVEDLGFEPGHVVVVHNPVPTYGFEPPGDAHVAALRAEHRLVEGTPTIGTIGRLDPVKGTDVLLAAMPTVLKAVPGVRLIILGDGSERAGLERQAAELDVADQVTFTGFRRDVAAHLPLFSVTAIPSVFEEPCPLSALESLAAGVPIVASRAGGLPELVEDGASGILVKPGNSVDLAAALVRVLTVPGLRAELSEGARRRAERFSLAAHLRRLERVYREVALAYRAAQ